MDDAGAHFVLSHRSIDTQDNAITAGWFSQAISADQVSTNTHPDDITRTQLTLSRAVMDALPRFSIRESGSGQSATNARSFWRGRSSLNRARGDTDHGLCQLIQVAGAFGGFSHLLPGPGHIAARFDIALIASASASWRVA
jgi:hypothetical protein